METNIEQAIRGFREFAFISAVLGGFVFAFIGALLTSENTKKVVDWALGSSVFGAFCFILSTLLSVLAYLIVSKSAGLVLPSKVDTASVWVRILFFLGIISIIVSLGVSGWIRSRQLGYLTATLAGFATFGVILTLSSF